MKAELRDRITIWLKEQGIVARPTIRQIAVNRDSMCNCKFAEKMGIPEVTAYPLVQAAIEKQFRVPHGFHWAGKTDDDLYLDIVNEWEG